MARLNYKEVLKGDAGATYTPHVTNDGVLYWTNNGDLLNPTPVNIKGKNGDILQEEEINKINEILKNYNVQIDDLLTSYESMSKNKMDINTKNISVSQINKNLGKFDESYLSDKLLQQMHNDLPLTMIPLNNSISKEKLINGSVDYDKTTFFNVEKSINVFNPNKITNIGYILNGEGDYKAQESGCVSDYIPVNENDVIRSNSKWNGEFYNERKEFIKEKPFGETNFIISEGISYYRQSIQNDLLNNTIITINNEFSTYTPYYENINISDEFKSVIKNDIIIEPNNTNFFTTKSINLFNKLETTDGFVINSDGQLKVSDNGCVTNFIEVLPKAHYYFSSNWNGAYYTSEKIFIKEKSFGITDDIAPPNAKYIRLSIPITMKESYMLTKDEHPSSYIPYSDNIKFIKDINLNDIAEQLINTGKFNDNINKKWCAIGDSLTEKNITAHKNYTDLVSERLKIECINKGIGGTGFKRKEEENKAFYQRIIDLPSDIDVITIFGSGNDLALMSSIGEITDSTTDTICGCVNKTIDNLLEKFPTTPMGIIAPTPWRGNTPNIIECQMSRYVDKLEEICKRRGIPYLDLYHYSNLHPNNDKCLNLTYYNKSVVDGNADGVHPNDLGHKIISTKIIQFLKTLI